MSSFRDEWRTPSREIYSRYILLKVIRGHDRVTVRVSFITTTTSMSLMMMMTVIIVDSKLFMTYMVHTIYDIKYIRNVERILHR